MGKNKPDKLEDKIYFYLLINEYYDADAAWDKWEILFFSFGQVFL